MADSLRTVIGTTLGIGALLTGILVLRGTRFAPAWLQPPAPESSTSTRPDLGAPVLPPPPPLPAAVTDVPPPPPAPSTADSVASAAPEPSASAPQPVASASAGKARKGGAPQRGEPEVVELPADFRYAPQGPGNLTFPVTAPTASTAAPR